MSVSPLTASSGADFQQITTTTVTFQPRETGSKSVVINIANDDIVENDEQFQVFITSSDADTRVLTSTATVTVLDDDCKCFCYSQFGYCNNVTYNYHPEYRYILTLKMGSQRTVFSLRS